MATNWLAPESDSPDAATTNWVNPAPSPTPTSEPTTNWLADSPPPAPPATITDWLSPERTATESAYDMISAGPKSLAIGFGNFVRANYSAMAQGVSEVAGLVGADWTAKQMHDLYNAIDASTREDNAALQGMVKGPVTELMTSAGQSLGQSLPALAVGVAFPEALPAYASVGALPEGMAATAAASAMSGYSQYLQSRMQAIDAGLSEWEATRFGVRDGAIESLTSAIPLHQILGAGDLFTKWMKGMLAEFPAEMVATALQDLNQKMTLNPDMPWADFTKQLAHDEVLTVATVPMIAFGSASFVRGAEKVSQVADLYRNLNAKSTLDKVGEDAKRQILDALEQARRDAQAEDENTVITYHGDNATREDLPDTSGQRVVNPGAAVEQRAAGLISSESNPWMGSYTFGSGKQESVSDSPPPQATTVQQPVDVRKFVQTPQDRWHGQVKRIVDTLSSDWNSDIELNVVRNKSHLPDEVVAQADKLGFNWKDTLGFYDGGNRVYLLTDNLRDVKEIPPTLFHESFGHYGMERVVRDWRQLVPRILKAAPSEMPAAWGELQRRTDYSTMQDWQKAKETLAIFAEQNPQATNTWLERIKGNLRQFAMERGFDRLAAKLGVNLEITNADVVNLLRKARTVTETGTSRRPGRTGYLRAAKKGQDINPGGYTTGQWRSEWDPAVRNWGEAHFDTDNFPIFEDASPGAMDTYSEHERGLLATGQPVILRAYHGSPRGDREGFSPDMLGDVTGANSARLGHFFATDPTNTQEYATMDTALTADSNSLLDALPYEDLNKVAEALPQRMNLRLSEVEGQYFALNTKTGEVTTLPYTSKNRSLAYEDLKNVAQEKFADLPYDQQMQMLKDILFTDNVRFMAPTTFPVYIAAKNPYVVDMAGQDYSEEPWSQAIKRGFDRGHDVVVMKNAWDPGLDNVVIVKAGNENQIRSVNARFDTAELPSTKLLASKAKLHRVQLNREMYLDFEAPLSGQTEKVKAALRAAGIAQSNMTGQELYDALVKTKGSKEAASEYLDSIGIHGATYREAFKGELVRNYITFSRSNAVALTAEQMKQLAAQKGRDQRLAGELLNERLLKSPSLAFHERMGNLFKAVKMGGKVQELAKDDITSWNLAIKYFYGIEELADANPHLPQLQVYRQAARDWWATKGSWTTDTNARIKAWKKTVGPSQQEDFDTLMYEADLKSQELGRQLTPEELASLIVDNGLKLGNEQVAFAQHIWDDYRRAFEEVRIALVEDIQRTISDPGEVARATREVNSAIEAAKDRNFFPKTNFGEWALEFKAQQDVTFQGRDYKKGEVVHYSTYVTEGDQDRALLQLQKIFPKSGFQETRTVLGRSKAMEFVGVPDSFINQLLERADLDPDAMAEVESTLEKLKQEQSATSRMMRRILKDSRSYGYDENSQRVYAAFMQRFSNQIAKLKHGPKMQQAIEVMAAELRGDATRTGQILDWMREHKKYMVDPGNELSWLRGMGFNMYIGGVVKSALVNLTQVPLVTLPYLSQRYNDLSAMKALALNTDAYFAQWDKTKPKRYSQEKLKMFRDLLAMGVLNESQANMLAAVAEGATLEDMLNKHSTALRNTDRAVRMLTDKWAALFHHGELFNRYITAGAAYDLAIKAGKEQQVATAEAAQAVRWTQGEYARYNRPLAMRGKRSAAFLFMRYQAHMMSIYFGNDPAKWRVLGMLVLASGLLGIPFAENVLDLFDLLATQYKKYTGWNDPKVQSRLELARWLEGLRASPLNLLGEHMPSVDTIMHGWSRSVPLPGASMPVDVSGSLGMGSPIPGTKELTKGPGQVDIGNILLQAGGALAQLPLDIWNASASDNPDVWKTTERAFPFMAGRNISAAYRWYKRGYEVNSQGQPIYEFDPEKDLGTIVYKALGFSPTPLNQIRETEYMQNDAKYFYANWRNELLKDWANSITTHNEDARKAAVAAILDYNRRVPEPELKIGPDSMKQSAYNRVRTEALHGAGIPAETKNLGLFRDIGEVMEKAR